jgi:hypothetical protein
VSSLRARAIATLIAAAAVAAGCGQAPTGPSAPSPSSPAARVDLAGAWVHSAPADVGLDAAALAAATAQAGTMPRFRSLLLARHGRLALERYFGGADAATSSTCAR